MLRSFKHPVVAAEPACMSTNSDASGGRFRRAELVTSSPEEQLQELLGDSARLYARFEELIQQATADADPELVVRLVEVGGQTEDPMRVLAMQRMAGVALHRIAAQQPRTDLARWSRPLELALQLLVPVLDAQPHEPELLYLLAVILHELGDDKAATRALERVLELEPQHPQARTVQRHVLQVVGRPKPDISRLVPSLDRFRPTIRSIIERAGELEDRRISLCMIVRDEEEMLPGCLAAAAPFVDEIIVVDTGSVDRTREIAREYGASVHEFPWNGSFSDARNESLRHATGDWILWLDADEQLVAEDGPQLRELARRTWVEGYQILETHFLGSGDDGTATHAPMRMFRRRSEYYWTGSIHEQVAWALPSWLPGRVQPTTVRVDHFGYMADVVEDRDKRARNLELLMAQHASDPSAFTSFNIGSEHAAAGDWQQAHVWLERSLSELRDEPGIWHEQQWAPLLLQRAVTARRLVGDIDGTIMLAEEGLRAWPQYTDLVYEQARAHADRGDWSEAAERARAALALGDAPARFVAVSGKGTFQARHVLAEALRQLGDAEAAREQLVAALRKAPHYLAALAELVDLLLEANVSDDELDSAVDEALGERRTAAAPNLLVGTRLHEAGRYEQADARYQRVLDASPTSSNALVGRAEVRLAQRRFDEAWEFGMKVDPLDRLAVAGAQSAFLAAAAMADPELVAAPADRIEHGESLRPTERAVYVAWRQVIAPGDGIRALVPNDDRARAVLLRNLEALARMHATDAFEQLHDALVPNVIPDEYERRLAMARLYIRLSFADMAGEELMMLADRFGPDAAILTGLGKVATIKEMWDDAAVFLGESLQLDPSQQDARRLLDAVQGRLGA